MQARVDTHLRAELLKLILLETPPRQISTSSKVLACSRHAADGARLELCVRACTEGHSQGSMAGEGETVWTGLGCVGRVAPPGMADACLGRGWAVTWGHLSGGSLQ